jgi:dsRNA-specific ribonuclease
MGRKKSTIDEETKNIDHKNRVRNYCKNRYHTDPVYREYMREKARNRKAMLREQKKK